MRPSVRAVHQLVDGIHPHDQLEAAHRQETLGWLAATDDVFRRARPATPPRHLVVYVVPVDPRDGSCLLGAHRLSGLWLPPGGHVEPDEHPVETARRETREELGIAAEFVDQLPWPVFVTVTETVERDHVDVSLWFLLAGRRGMALTVDTREFAAVRWWTPVEVRAEPGAPFDPHTGRFLAKTAGQDLWPRPP